MSNDGVDRSSVPEGLDFIRLIADQEDACEEETFSKIPTLGRKAPLCLERLGTVLSFLDRIASCWYGCQGGDHLLEYLCGRGESTARASIRLMGFGFYDEALAAARSIGELANLFYLFSLNGDTLTDWKTCSRGERLQRYTPAQVRRAIEREHRKPLISHERYTLLCERAAHVQPQTKPQAHNVLGISSAGAHYQEAGVLVSLNELALPVAIVTAFGARLLPLSDELRSSVSAASRGLIESIGNATLDGIDEHFHRVLSDPDSAARVEEVANELRRIQSGRQNLGLT